jgi:hypothetical protein
MIPNTIHTIWLGKKPKPALETKCLKSWQKYCPNFEIIEWNEDNFDLTANLYCKQAYQHKIWAFCSNYMRLYILYHHGGIYLDTDCEILKPLDEFYLTLPAVIGFSGFTIGTGFIAAEKGNSWIKKMLDWYEDNPLIKDGIPDTTRICDVMFKVTQEMYPDFQINNREQHYECVTIYPNEYFFGQDPYKWRGITKNTYIYHHGSKSWRKRNVVQIFREFLWSSYLKTVGQKAYEKYPLVRKLHLWVDPFYVIEYIIKGIKFRNLGGDKPHPYNIIKE